MLSSTTTTTPRPHPRAGYPRPHLQLSAAAHSAPPVVVSIRQRYSTHLRSHDTVRALRFLDQAEARRATSTTVRLGGVPRRSIHAELADREETAERPERKGARMRGHERGLAKLCTIVLFFFLLGVVIPLVVGCGFVCENSAIRLANDQSLARVLL